MKVFIILFQVALVGAQSEITKITAYVNDTVVLPSGAAEGETLKNIEWSIFLNNTYIATYGNKTPNVDWIYQFKGRLNLNSSSGNLSISNVRLSDTMVYKVDRISDKSYEVHKVDLTVRERLHTPALTAVGHLSKGGRCFALLQCSSHDDGVSLSWHVSVPGVTVINQTESRNVILLVIINKTQDNVKINCTARKDSDYASNSITTDCPGDSTTHWTSLPPPTVKPSKGFLPLRCRDLLAASISFFFGLVLGALLVICCPKCLQKCEQ